ncbi:MAG: hypothetical protein AB1458_11525 [Bacteroidota bacterium]
MKAPALIFFSLCVLLLHAQNKSIPSGIYYDAEKNDSTIQLINASDTVNIYPTPALNASDFKKVKVVKTGYAGYAVEITFTDAGREKLASATEKWLTKRMAMVFGNRLILAPTVMAKIPGGKMWISHSMTKQEAKKLKAIIEAEMKVKH